VAVAGEEVELLEEGTRIVAPTKGAFALNVFYRHGAWRVRKGFGQVTQFTTRMTQNQTTDLARSDERIDQKWGYQRHLGSRLITTGFGHEQIVSVFYCQNNTGSGPSRTTVLPLYCVNIYDITTDTRWEEPIYLHTSTQKVDGQVVASQKNLGQDVESWYGHYDTDLDADAQKWVGADPDEYFYFEEFSFRGDTTVLFFGSKRTGLMYYVPATFPETPQFKFVDSEFRHEWANPYGESSLVQQATIRVPRTAVGESNAFFKQDEVGVPDVVTSLGSRLVYAVGRTIFFSDGGSPTTIGTDNFITLPSDGDVVAMSSINGQLLILTSDESFVFQPSSGATVAAGRLIAISDNVGCVGPNAIVRVEDLLFFVDKSGVYTYSGDLQVRLSSGAIDSYFTDYASNPLTSFLDTTGYTPLLTDQPHTTLYFKEPGVNCAYSPELRALFITVPEQNLTLCLANSKWSFWSYTSSAYVVQPSGAPAAASYPGIIRDTDNPDGFITMPWLVSGQEDLFLVGGPEKQRLTDAAQKKPSDTVIDVDDDVQSFSAYILRYGRGGGIDRSIRDEDDRFVAGKYVIEDPDGYPPSTNAAHWYVDPWIPVQKGYVFPNGYTVALGDNVWLLPVSVVPPVDLLDSVSGEFYVNQFKIWIRFDNTHWKPVLEGTDQTSGTQIDFLLPSERVASWKGYFSSYSPNTAGTSERVEVATSSGGAPLNAGDMIRIEWAGQGSQTTTDWYHFPNMNIGPNRKSTLIYIPMRATDGSYNVSGMGLVADRSTTNSKVMPWLLNGNTGSGTTNTQDGGFIPWEQWTTTSKRALDSIAQPVEWAYKSPKVGGDDIGVKARGLFSRFLSQGPGTVANYLVPTWAYGLFNISVASEQKGWTMQIVDTNDDSSAAESPAWDESRSETTIRTRVKDSSAGLINKTFGTTGLTWGNDAYADRAEGTYLIDDPGPEVMSTSLSVKGRSFTYMIFGFIQERAQALSFESAKAVFRRLGGRRRRGR